MKNLFILFLLMFYSCSFSQGIVVDTTTLSIPQLIQDELMQNSCSTLTNFLFSSHKGIGKFINTNANFPISNGIIIRNGIAKYTEGNYTGIDESSQLTTLGDIDIQYISDKNGQIAPISDVAFIQFDFTPSSSNFSFDFIFASNEYGQYQCGFSDVFTFLLTDLTSGNTTNLGVIPETTIPVSVKNIRNNAYNPSCLSANSNLFSRYNVANPTASAINMRGETALLKASSTVVPNRTYRMKLAIGDYYDSNLDSAVFIKGGSFTTTTHLGPDQMICEGETILLDSGLGSAYNFSWTLNGVNIPSATGPNLKATQKGTYGITATLPASGCTIIDEITLSDFKIKNPTNLHTCYSSLPYHQYDLTQNNIVSLGLNPTDFTLMYFASLVDANANEPVIPASQIPSYSSLVNKSIYVKVVHNSNRNAICNKILSFDLLMNEPIKATTPPDMNLCSNDSAMILTDLTVQNATILNGQNAAGYAISYFTSQTDAENNINPILNPNAFKTTILNSPQTIWVRMVNVSQSTCFDIINFNLIVSLLPPIDSIPDVTECSSYILPPITNGNYYTGPNKTGLLLHAGDVIHNSGTYYIFNGPITPDGCTNQNSFAVTFIKEISFPTTSCGQYTVLAPAFGNFFTGPSGRGTLIAAETIFTTNQTIYYYAAINGIVCRDEALVITIFPLPPVDNPSNIITCNSYQLPSLTNGNYYTGSDGTGTPLKEGTVLTTSQNVYVFINDGRCTNQNMFRVNIIDTSIYQPISSCGSYTLPNVPFGNYYNQPLGAGDIIPAKTTITSSQTVYYYAKTSTTPNCTNNLNYQITIKPLPTISNLSDEIRCKKDYFILPHLSKGNYYDQPNGLGKSLKEGDPILLSGTYYIHDVNDFGCPIEDSFTITYRNSPPVESFTDVFTCTGFKLPPLLNGKYYTASGGPNGSGTVIKTGTIITASQTIYIYNQWDDFSTCGDETFFGVDAKGLEVGTFEDVTSCDSYTLPVLAVGNYYSQPNGQGAIILAGSTLTTSQTIYVHASIGTRLSCSDDTDFTVTISTTPILTKQKDIEACDSYTLPPLVLGNYFSGSNGTGTRYVAGQKIIKSQLMYIYASSKSNASCSTEEKFNITIYPLKDLKIDGGVICVDFSTGALLNPFEITTGLNPEIFTAEWSLNGVLMGTGVNYSATEEGNYLVTILKKTNDIGNDCNYKPTTVLVEKSSLPIANAEVTAPFEDSIDIIITITNGFGSYEYQLENGSFQTDNVFHDVPSGVHNITINDTKGNCGTITLSAKVLKYPKYFTPNADGNNDFWNIWDITNQPDAVIYLYDRYGKLIKQFSPASSGWDGTDNGHPLPASDYWFQVFYKYHGVDQEFKAHFSMKR
ncbi:T9SS type B sorting domain-containing protein [Flavobacterium xinjiangense]|uniref:Gliding motility-associated C-terminal domain-containing protein n=1 Tax=Flavobacterium xinjiangense TaxID=178356 RepID=A0A1M7PGD9_9FLAO|nr:T9SS type B sorting domain-containing protein [Flavobacterium xinjiangense]SHN16120.1 gliding motility-associated C-terminal domain-containing protein [Flavobacterium xinjiangense]